MRILWIIIGSISLLLGVIGAFLPVLPTTPFLLLTAYCYSKGSDKFHSWFISSSLYKKYMEDYLHTKTMTLKHKVVLLTAVSIISGTMFTLTHNTYLKYFLCFLIIGHILYFGFYVKTKKK